MGMNREIYDEILLNCGPGPNEDSEKAQLLRSFQVPSRFIEDHSSSSDRTVNIFAAWVSDDYAWVLVDFARIVRFHVLSCDAIWQRSKLSPKSPLSDPFCQII